MKTKVTKIIKLALGMSLAFLAAHTAGAATITVTNTADNGAGSLRQALASAADGDTIDASGVSGTILLTSGELLVTKNLTILGPGPANLAVDGNFPNTTNRVFHIGSNTVVSISSLTITNGHAFGPFPAYFGGGIYNDHATLTVSNCTLSSNSAGYNVGGGIGNDLGALTARNCTFRDNHAGFGGGIGNSGTLTVSGCTFTKNIGDYRGGGIYNGGALAAVNCTFIANEAAVGGGIFNEEESTAALVKDCTLTANRTYNAGGGIFHNDPRSILTVESSTITDNIGGLYSGGGIFAYGPLTVHGCTISDNTTYGDGGGIYIQGIYEDDQGGVLIPRLLVENSTISDNSAWGLGGGISSYANATLTVQNSTLSGNSATNGGGIYNGYGTVEIGSTILNAGALGGNITNDSGTVTSLGYNLSSDDGGGFLTATGDQINTDPLLGPLQDNGGPTLTMALLPGSPCINAGDPGFVGPPIFDQRGPGFARVVDGRVDIGAFEVQPPTDSDGDGVPDAIDQCSDTPAGDIVNSTGCSIAQLVPCEGPRSGGTWKNHGQYVRAVLQTARDFRKAKLITRRQWAQIVRQAAHSKCGSNHRRDQDGDRDRDGDSNRDRGRD